MFLPFVKWRAEHPEFGYGHMTNVLNLRPLQTVGYAPVRNPSNLTVTHNAGVNTRRATAYYVHPSLEITGGVGGDTFGWRYWRYFGTADKLFEWPLTGGSATDVSARSYLTEANGLASPLDPEVWKFHSWGKVVLATNYANPVQRLAYSGGGAFADCITSTGSSATNPAKPKARFISSLGQHVVLANIYLPSDFPDSVTPALDAGTHQQLVWWSKTDDETAYSDETSDPLWNSSYQPLVDLPGPITGLAKVGDDGIVIFKPGGSHLMSRTGDSSLYSFQVLHQGGNAGTGSNTEGGTGGSVVVYGKDVYYVSESGIPCVMRGLGQPQPLLRNTIRYYVEAATGAAVGVPPSEVGDSYNVEPYVGMADERNGYVAWLVPDDPSCILYYQVDTGAVSVQQLDGVYCAGATSPYNPYLEIVHEDFVSDFRTVKKLDPESGTQPSWTATTGYVNLQPVEPKEFGIGFGSTAILRLRPVFSDDTSTKPKIVVTTATTLQMASSRDVTMDPAAGFIVDSQGWYTPEGGKIVGEMFKFSVVMPSGGSVGSVIGLQIEAEAAGVR